MGQPFKAPFFTKTRRFALDNRQGVSVIIVIQLFAVMLVFAFMAINLATIQRNRSNSQIAADLGSRWGVELASNTEDTEDIEKGVREIVEKNWNLNSRDKNSWVTIEVGSAKPGENGMTFEKGAKPTNAVRVDCGADIAMTGLVTKKGNFAAMSRRSTAVAVERDICVVIDRSGSMNFDLDTGTWSTDRSESSYNPLSTSRYYSHRRSSHQWYWYWPHPTQSRWSTMVPALYGLAEELENTEQNELFSIVSYSTSFNYNFYNSKLQYKNFRGLDSSEESAPSFDYTRAVKDLEYKYNYTQPVAGGTNITAGIELATKVLLGSKARPNAFKTMIVMTDGQYNSGGHPRFAAAEAAEEGIEVYTVTFSNQADQSAMYVTADEGNGRHFHAPDGDALEEVFRQIANIPPAAYID